MKWFYIIVYYLILSGASKVDRERANKERRSKQNNTIVQKGKGNKNNDGNNDPTSGPDNSKGVFY